MTIEYRVASDIKLDDAIKGRVVITPMVYNTTDSYKTRFAPGCFTEFLEGGGLPVFCWGHDWLDPIGQTVDYNDNRKRLQLLTQLDDPEAVPRARQAYAQLSPNQHTGKPTLTDISVGFERQAVEEGGEGDDWDYRFTKCRLPEASVVVSGAVPGALVNTVRSQVTAGLGIREADLHDLELRLASGAITLEDAMAELRLRSAAARSARIEAPVVPPGDTEPSPPTDDPEHERALLRRADRLLARHPHTRYTGVH